MKYILIILFAFTVNAQDGVTRFFVNWYASGSNNGISWTNAWNNLSDIDWDDISAGDTIYVSGGTDSTTYMPEEIYGIRVGNTTDGDTWWTFASGNPVVLCPSWEANHNGDVYLATSSDNQYQLLKFGNISNIKITGFTFVDRRGDPAATDPSLIQLGNADWGDMDSLIYFEHNHVIANGNAGFIFLNGSKITVDSNYFEQVDNSKANDQDPFGISSGRGGHTISNNIAIMRNDNVGTDAHRDGVQFSNFGLGEGLGGVYATERLPIFVYNNLIIDTKSGGSSWNSLIYSSGPYCNASFYIYNNILVSSKTNASPTAVWIGKGGVSPWTSYDNSLYVLNNTIILKGDGTADIFSAYNHDTLIAKNNLFVLDTTATKINNLDGADGFPNCYKVFDYNIYALYGGSPPAIFSIDNGNNISWTDWRDTPYDDDINSSLINSTAVSFDNKYGITPQDYYTTTGRDGGEDLSEYNWLPEFTNDILGNPRSGTWDIGALEYQGTVGTPTRVRMRQIIIQ